MFSGALRDHPTMRTILLVTVVGLSACGQKPGDAKAACETLAKEIGGSNCKEDQPAGLGAAAWSKYAFDLEEPKGKTCQVLAFKKAEDLEATAKAFDGAAMLAGPHRYSNKAALIYVQCNEGMPRPTGEKLEAALGKLN